MVALTGGRNFISPFAPQRRAPRGGVLGVGDQLMRAATPGRVLPSIHSKNAPPAVEI